MCWSVGSQLDIARDNSDRGQSNVHHSLKRKLLKLGAVSQDFDRMARLSAPPETPAEPSEAHTVCPEGPKRLRRDGITVRTCAETGRPLDSAGICLEHFSERAELERSAARTMPTNIAQTRQQAISLQWLSERAWRIAGTYALSDGPAGIAMRHYWQARSERFRDAAHSLSVGSLS